MAYFNNNANFYPAPAAGEFDMYPSLSRVSATEEANNTTFTLADIWGVVEGPGPMVDPLASLQGVALNSKCYDHPSPIGI
jgi:hypothetical protein